MTDYLKPKFSVPVGSDAYRDNWEATFRSTAHQVTECWKYRPGCKYARCRENERVVYGCPVCDSFNGAFTTDCPGERMTEAQNDAVYAGTLDYRAGRWVNAPSGSCASHPGGYLRRHP